MSQPGNPAGGETPPSSPSQTSPIQTHVTANNESHIINEPSQPLNNAGGRRAPLGIQEPRQPPLGANQESHIIKEQLSPPHHATAGRRTPPSLTLSLGIGEPHQTPRIASQESHIINPPFQPPHHHAAHGRITPPSLTLSLGIGEPHQTPRIANQESHIINPPFQPPHHHAAHGRITPPSLTLRLGIGEPHQTPRIANQECHTINPPFQPPHHHAAHGRITPPSPSSKRQLGIQEPSQPPSRVNNESLTIRQPSPSLYFPGLTELQALNDQYLLLSKRYKLQNQQHALRVNQESHTIKKPSRVNQESHTIKKPSSSSEGRRGGVVALRCANCKNTSTTQWRSDPTGQKWQSLCNACWNGLNRVEETRAASGLQSLNTLCPPPMLPTEILARALHILRNRDEDIENNDNQFVPENNFLGPSSGLQSLNLNIVPPPPEMPPPAAPLGDPPEEASETESSGQNWTDKTPDNSPGA